MRNFIERRRASEKGFTLIELLVVIVILGILAAVVVFAIGGINDNGQESACEIDARTISTAEEAYYAENLEYATMAELTAGPTKFLADASELHTIAITGTGANEEYALTPVGDCAP